MTTVRLHITGLVQGVFFRAETQKKARELGLTGWVRNCENGSVEIVAEGPAEKLKEFEHWCWRGPPRARVDDVQVTEDQPENFTQFEIVP